MGQAKSLDMREVRDRLHWLMDKLWRSSQTAMARDLGVTQGTIGNILAGRRKPGRVLLDGLASHPLVNEEWLRSGDGPPLLVDSPVDAGELALPIARELFAGGPYDSPECLEPVLYPVSRRLYRRSRYWLRVDSQNHPFANTPNMPVREGDWVLLESDRHAWPKDLRGKGCVIRVRGETELLCAMNVSSVKGRGMTSDYRHVGPHGNPNITAEVSGERKGRKRVIDLVDSESAKPDKVENVEVKNVEVVAVAIYRCGEL